MHPIDHVNKMHNGIDIKTNHEAVLATEQGGKVIDAGFDTKGGGNYVKLEYSREDGSKTNSTSATSLNHGQVVIPYRQSALGCRQYRKVHWRPPAFLCEAGLTDAQRPSGKILLPILLR
jgi:predicted nucleic acid-binding Zn ribbon protein